MSAPFKALFLQTYVRSRPRLYTAEIYRPSELSFLLLTMWVSLHSISHVKLRNF